MPEIPCKQNSDEWYKIRSGHVTASCFGDVLTSARSKSQDFSASAMTYMLELVAEHLTGSPAEQVIARPLQWGHDNEPYARELYCWKHGEVDEVGFYTLDGEKWIGCSPDGFVGSDGIVQIKCPYTSKEHVRTMLNNKVPDDYWEQVQGELWVTGRKWLDYVSYDPRMPKDLRMHVIRVEADPDFTSKTWKILDFRDAMISKVEVLKKTVEHGNT